ncbi:MAG: YicC family protein [Deltaproteobacteria bacterium]|nr:YicC family protein [Deltaproteobacteria bacterium]
MRALEVFLLKSMTGCGSGRAEIATIQVAVELKAVNGRFLKVSVKAPPAYASLEGELEAVVRERLRRGSVTLAIYVTRTDLGPAAEVNAELAAAYKTAFERLGLPVHVVGLLPGVVVDRQQGKPSEVAADERRLVSEALGAALAELVRMREREGAALKTAIAAILARMVEVRAVVRARAPEVVKGYKARLEARLAELIGTGQAGVDPALLAREVAVFADRADITEELERLAAHFEHARELLAQGDDVGRRLDFLAQEMLREANTIGSKSADASLSQQVVELKAQVEQLKEQVANVE